MVTKHHDMHENLDDLDSESDIDIDDDVDDDTCPDDRAEAESRRLDAMTLDAINCSDPFKMATVGPGSNPGPRKYLGVAKPQILFECTLNTSTVAHHILTCFESSTSLDSLQFLAPVMIH